MLASRTSPDVPMATAMAQPMVAQPMVAQPMVMMAPHPYLQQTMAPQAVVPMVTALGNQDGLPASPLVLGPPQPCRKTSWYGVDKLQSNFSTGSPAATYAYKAPTMDGMMTEAGFDRAVCMVDAEQGDPLAALLSEGRKVLDLAIDVEGRMSDMKKVLKHNCYATIGCLLNPFCTLCVLGEICAATHPMSCDGEGEGVEKLRVQANAHHLAITDRAVVYTRDAHVGVTTKNYIAFDQYGHRYPAVSQSESQVPAASLHVPLQHAELEVCAKKEIQPSSLNVTPWSDKCFDNTPDALVIVLRAGEGVRLVVACVEAGPASNAAAFVAEFARLKKNAPALSPELEAAYNSWFGQRLARSGTMAGAAPRANQTMDRGGVPGQAGNTTVKFVRSVGPLPPDLGILKSSMNQNSMLHFNVPKTGHINGIRHGPYVGQLDADDRILSVNNVRVPGGNNPLTQQYLDQVQAASPPGGGGFMQVSTGAPHFQPSHMLTVGPMPPGATTTIQFAADRMPPLILQPDAAAAASGLLKGDIVMQAVVDGVTHNTNGMTGQQLLGLTQAAQATVLTVLQTHRMPSGQMSELPWVLFGALRP
jgi:hypothetical protein